MSVTEMIKVLPTQPGRYLAAGTACSHGLQRQRRHQAQRLLQRRDTPNCMGEPLPKWLTGSSLPPSFWNPSEMQERDPGEDLDQERPEAAPAATTWQAALGKSSNPPISPKDHPVMLFTSCLSLPFCQRNCDHTPGNPHQQGPGQCWHDPMSMDEHLLSSRTFCT